MSERHTIYGDEERITRLLHEGLRTGEYEMASMPRPSVDYPGLSEAVVLKPATQPPLVRRAPRPRRRLPVRAKVGLGVGVTMLLGGLGWAMYLIVAAIVAHWAAVLGALVVALLLLGWFGLGQAGVCPGLHCPGCKCR